MSDFDMKELNVLLIEDNKHMQLVLKDILRSFHVKNVNAADDGADALEVLKNFPVDVVISDLNMQPIDGLDFVRLVRTGADSTNPTVPIIMLTGHTETHRVLEARDAGVTEFLAKPVSAKKLHERLRFVVEHPRPFIQTRRYTGPDRRRTPATSNTDRGRRASDQNDAVLSQAEITSLLGR